MSNHTSKRDAFVKRLHEQIDATNSKIDDLEVRAHQAEADAQVEYQERIATLRERRNTLQKRVNELGEASEDAWESLQEGVNNAWNELSDAVSQAQDRIREEA
jgi:predicted  nucleic acid-binding Zn-ribbon protein